MRRLRLPDDAIRLDAGENAGGVDGAGASAGGEMTCTSCFEKYKPHGFASNVCLNCYARIVPEAFWPKGVRAQLDALNKEGT